MYAHNVCDVVERVSAGLNPRLETLLTLIVGADPFY